MRLLVDHRDVLDARVAGGEPPRALVDRGWAEFLLARTDIELEAIESGGVWPEDTPPSLRRLIDDARAACDLPEFPSSEPSAPRIGESPRKRAQIDAFARVIAPLARGANRVLDVGSGHGHLTRDIAERVGVPAFGLERDVALAERARAFGASASFEVRDVLREGLDLQPSDLVIGLHACGELGDVMVESAARSGASIALVACCPQKRRSDTRLPLSKEGIELGKRTLGLANLVVRDVGVEATRAENLAARERRLALHRLLLPHEPGLRHGAEIEGLNRRVAHADLTTLVARAFAVRALPAPTAAEIEAARIWAAEHHARARRLSLPRTLLARVLEVHLLRDRAAYLEQHGFDVAVGTLFSLAVSARNLALVASKRISAG
ncbi:MAG: methyltransferase [Polyangiales bacterium]